MTLEQLVADFAKQMKVSKAKALAFAEAIQAMSKPAGRPVTDESQRIREAIKQSLEELKGVHFTAKELAEKFNSDPATIGNNLRFLMNKEHLVSVAGKKAKEQGKKGRQELIWQVA